ncbi:chitosanase [Streptomyces sp. NPDC058377]|uniref:chitosanase n=1 Tax=Streptomyces sp. NPDC058377 TaxID=3346468 RepID=UPI0036518B24
MQRWTGTVWADMVPQRWTGTEWVTVGSVQRWTGTTWMEMLPATGNPPVVNAGADAVHPDPLTAFTRTATEDTSGGGGTVTSRAWTIMSGPMGTGTTIGTAAALSWIPGSSPSGTVDIRQPVCMEMAFEINSTAENGTLDWTSAYDYIEDINDQRGYTAGLVGFCSGTGDMLLLIQEYAAAAPGNILAGYLPGLQACADVGFGPGASAAAATHLGAAYLADWAAAANTDPIFRAVQRAFRQRIYWDDCLVQAIADGVGPLGLALHYDVLVNHGIGNNPQSYGGIIAAARASASKPPSQGGSEAAYLTKICDLRDAVLIGWGDYQEDGRSSMFRGMIDSGYFDLLGPVPFSIYGTPYTINRPAPPSDARIGTYTLRYAATAAGGTGTDTLVVTVEDDTEPLLPLLENLVDDFNDNSVSAVLWPGSYGGVTETGGRARVPVSAAYAGFESAAAWQLKDSGVFVEVPTLPAVGGTEEAYVSLVISGSTDGTSIGWTYNLISGMLRAVSNVDYWDDAAVSLTYSSTAHRWWRVRETGSTVYWDTSPDGVTWTQRRSLTTPAWAAAATTLGLSLEAVRDTGAAAYAEFDNLNVAP